MYTRMRKASSAAEQISRLDAYANAAANDSLNKDLLYTKASHYYTFGMTAKGDEAIDQLIKEYREAKQYDKVIDTYRTLIGIARKSGNAAIFDVRHIKVAPRPPLCHHQGAPSDVHPNAQG